MSAWGKSSTNSTWSVLHQLMIERIITILMVNQVKICDNVSNKFVSYSCFLLWMLRHALCFNTRLVLMYLLCLNAHTYRRNCYTFDTCYLGIIPQCFCLMQLLTSLMMNLWNYLVFGAFMAWWQYRLPLLLIAVNAMGFIMHYCILRSSLHMGLYSSLRY